MGSNPPTFSVDSGSIRFRFMTFLGFIIGFTTIVASAAALYNRIPTKEDVASVVESTNKRLAIVVDNDKDQDKAIALQKQAFEALNENNRYIRSRVELLTEKAILESQTTPAARQRIQAAASRVREGARARGERADPLSGIDLADP